MKILKLLLGVGAIGGAVVYARKHGGFKNAFNGLVAKKDELLTKLSTKKEDDEPAKKEEPAPTVGNGSFDEASTPYSPYGSGYSKTR